MKETMKKLVKGLFKTTKSTVITICVCAALIFVTIGIPIITNYTHSVDSTLLLSTIKESSELTTAKITFTGMSEFKDTGVVFINRSDFNMVYNATVDIGLDLEKVEVKLNKLNKTITVLLPHTSVLDVNIDFDSIKYFDEHFSIFNVDKKDDANEANSLAEKEAKKEISKMGVIDLADEQAKALIENILINAIPKGYEIEFEFIK